MHLLIENPDNLDIKDFVEWIMKEISSQALSNRYRKLEVEKLWDEYFNSVDFGWRRDEFGKQIVPTVNFIINQFFTNLRIYVVGNNFDITVDPEVKIMGTDISVENLATVMNYGTLDMQPYGYFELMFELFGKSIQDLYDEWILTDKKMSIYKEEVGN